MVKIICSCLVLFMVANALSQGVYVRRAPRIPAAGGAEVTYFHEETFEDGTDYDLGSAPDWYEVGAGTIDPNDTNDPGAGSESLSIATTGSLTYVYETNSFTVSGKSEVYGKFMFYVSAFTSGNPRFTLSRVGVADDMFIDIYGNGSGDKIAIRHGTTDDGPGSTAISTGTWYWCWFHYVEGTGSDGVLDVWINTSDSKPGPTELDIANGNGTSTPLGVTMQLSGTETVYWDNVQLAEEDFE